jgi:hypothetical protein
MTEFVVHLANRPGMLAALTEALAEAGVAVEGLAAYGFDEDGIVRLVVGDATPAREAIRAAGLRAEEYRVLTTSVPHHPGGLAELTRSLADAGVNIEALYVLRTRDGEIDLAIAVDEHDEAVRRIGERSGTTPSAG